MNTEPIPLYTRLRESLEDKLTLYEVVRSWAPNDEMAITIVKLLLEDARESPVRAVPDVTPAWRYLRGEESHLSINDVPYRPMLQQPSQAEPPAPIKLPRRIP